jgi:dipeptidyl aminopeptidase/acylaminoacyl peptidase
MTFRILKTGVCAAAFAVAFINVSTAAVKWPMELLKTAPQTYDASKYATNTGVQVTFFDGLPFKGKPTRVFAYYGIPKHKPGEKVPAMVLVHGGGGSAFHR